MLLPNDHITQTCVTRPRFYNSRFLRLIIIISHLMHLTLRQLPQVGINAKNKNLSLQGSGDHGWFCGRLLKSSDMKFFPTFERHDSWGDQLLGKGKGILYTNDIKSRLIKEIAFELWYLLSLVEQILLRGKHVKSSMKFHEVYRVCELWTPTYLVPRGKTDLKGGSWGILMRCVFSADSYCFMLLFNVPSTCFFTWGP